MMLAVLATVVAPARAQYAADNIAPFNGVRWTDDDWPEVRLGQTWYRFEGINTTEARDILDYCKSKDSKLWQLYFENRFVPVLREMGAPLSKSVVLLLTDLKSGERISKPVLMSQQNWYMTRRERIAQAANKRLNKYRGKRVQRDRPVVDTSNRFWSIGARPKPAPHTPRTARVVHAPRPQRDVEQLEWHLLHNYAFPGEIDQDMLDRLDVIYSRIGRDISARDFGLQVHKVLSLLGDSRARLPDWPELMPPGYLPFLVESVGERLVAFKPDRSGFVQSGFPYLVSIDGRPMAQWMETAGLIVGDASEHGRRRSEARALRYINYLRSEYRDRPAKTIQVVLESEDGQRRSVEMDLADEKPIYGRWPLESPPQRLEGGIGYMRLARMRGDTEFVQQIRDQMDAVRGTAGLVLDMRGNTGDSREPILALVPYFLDPAGEPVVASVATLRLDEEQDPQDPGLLEQIHMYPASWEGWIPAQRQVIERFAADFQPELGPPGEGFSSWRYLVVSPGSDDRVYHYDRPVVVLMDASCDTSATVLLGALKGLPNVTLMGTPSRGGTDHVNEPVLVFSNAKIDLPDIISYRPDGRLYRGRGVKPDVPVEPKAEDFIQGSDSLLDAALARLR